MSGVLDSHERYAYRLTSQQVDTIRQALPCRDHGLIVDGQLIASVERKSLADLVVSLIGGERPYQVADLSALVRAAVVVEDCYLRVTLDRDPSRDGGRRAGRAADPLARRRVIEERQP